MRVYFSSHFRGYTGGKPFLEAAGPTLGAVLLDLDRLHPGLRSRAIDEQGRVRRHVKLFVNLDATEDLGVAVRPSDEVHVLGALSGG